MVWLPAASADVVKATLPALSTALGPESTAAGAAHVPPSMKVTLPEVTPGVTVAVNVTESPTVDEGALEVRVVVELVVQVATMIQFAPLFDTPVLLVAVIAAL